MSTAELSNVQHICRKFAAAWNAHDLGAHEGNSCPQP
jgi:hypothetical protein